MTGDRLPQDWISADIFEDPDTSNGYRCRRKGDRGHAALSGRREIDLEKGEDGDESEEEDDEDEEDE